MLSNYCCAQMSNIKRLRLLGHTLRQGYDVRPVYTFCTKLRRILYPDDNYIFQQDSAPSHRCRLAQKFLQANTPDFIHSDAFPPNSPYLNPLDYYVWNALKELVYAGRRKPFINRLTDELKQVIEEKWSQLNDRHIQKSIGQWKQRVGLRIVTREGGGPIKHFVRLKRNRKTTVQNCDHGSYSSNNHFSQTV